MGQGIFITGTDTGVGKTTITCALATKLRAQGKNICVMKPFLTGAKSRPNDVDRLIHAAQVSDPLEIVNPYQFEHPLAPQIAATLEGIAIDIKKVKSSFDILQSRHDILLVEGIGGVMTPIMSKYSIVNLIQYFQIPALVVTRADLGTINHTLLTINALKENMIPITALIINYPNLLPPEIEPNTTLSCIKEFTNIPVHVTVEHIDSLDSEWDEGIHLLAKKIQIENLF